MTLTTKPAGILVETFETKQVKIERRHGRIVEFVTRKGIRRTSDDRFANELFDALIFGNKATTEVVTTHEPGTDESHRANLREAFEL
jgi:hypothetical protein